MMQKARSKKNTVRTSLRPSQLRSFGQDSWNRERVAELLDRLEGRRVAVIGDVGIDRYTIGTVERISPEAPVPIVRVEEEKHKLGLAANVADNIRSLGGEPLLSGIIGKDRWASEFKALLRKEKISPKYLVADGTRRTVLKERVVSDRQQLLRVDYESQHALGATAERALGTQIRGLVGEAEALIVEDYAKGMLNPELLQKTFELARVAGKIVAVDPNLKTPVEWYAGATLLTPNTKEAEKLAGQSIHNESSLLAVGNRILDATSARHVVITRGKEGMAIFTRGVRAVHLIPTFAREVYDVSGAGDTVIATLTLALCGGASIEEAALLGNLAAGVEVGKRGTATVTRSEILSFLQLLETFTKQVTL